MNEARTEFDEWAKRFEGRESFEYRDNRRVTITVPPQCMYAVREGPHKRACLADAEFRSDGLPVCARHQLGNVRKSWKGYVRGA